MNEGLDESGTVPPRAANPDVSSPHALGLHPPDKYEVFTSRPSEIVIGLVGPVGTDNDKIRRLMTERITEYGYNCEVIRVSSVIIPALAGPGRITKSSKYERAKQLIDLGNQIRKESKNNAVMAIALASEIRRRRPAEEQWKTAYIVGSLKLPQEVAELRKIYGSGFYLFAVHTDRDRRVQTLAGEGAKDMTVAQAWELITRDEHEREPYGQHTRDTFHLADFFLADENNDDKLRHSINRSLDLIFGNALITPEFNEFAMFMAFAASLRSADLSRQVGAVVARGTEILSTGANDCPAPAGGLYWPAFIGDRIDDVPRGRDYKRGYDSNTVAKNNLIEEILTKFPSGQQEQAREILKGSPIKDITEYGRVVHAEMEALLACARSHTSCVGATIFCTTFPCHNCAKHIIAAGIDQVIYVEPYPKSKAFEFHDEAVTTEPLTCGDKRVQFKPFIGVGPRQFFDLFSLSLSSGRPVERKASDGTTNQWSPSGATPRVQMLPASHRNFEVFATEYLSKLTGEKEQGHAPQ